MPSDYKQPLLCETSNATLRLSTQSSSILPLYNDHCPHPGTLSTTSSPLCRSTSLMVLRHCGPCKWCQTQTWLVEVLTVHRGSHTLAMSPCSYTLATSPCSHTLALGFGFLLISPLVFFAHRYRSFVSPPVEHRTAVPTTKNLAPWSMGICSLHVLRFFI